MCAAAAGRLAVAADPVAGERQQQRRDAERAEGGEVEEQARRRSPRRRRRSSRAASATATTVTSRRSGGRRRVASSEERRLEERGDEDDRADLERVAATVSARLSLRHEHEQAVERAEVRVGLDLDLLVRVGVVLADEGDGADRDALRESGLEGRAARARGDDRSPSLTAYFFSTRSRMSASWPALPWRTMPTARRRGRARRRRASRR